MAVDISKLGFEFRCLLFSLIVLGLAACAILPVGGYAEPKVIAVRNLSGADISTVTLRQSGISSSQVTRFGSISPLPSGITQSVGRATDPPRLSRTVTLEWIDKQGGTYARDLSLTEVLMSASGSMGETLVFEIGLFGDVRVFIERPVLNTLSE